MNASGNLRILILSNSFDTGGQGSRLVEAFAETDWTVRSMVREATYFAFPVDLPFRRQSLEDQYQLADVVHARNDFTLYDQMAAKFGPKPVVIHFHGTKFRSDPNFWIRQVRKYGAIAMVSTLDLWLLAPDELIWLPAPYDVDALEEM